MVIDLKVDCNSGEENWNLRVYPDISGVSFPTASSNQNQYVSEYNSTVKVRLDLTSQEPVSI
jgi:hypothetical protein